jgi:hypothetical protein
VFKTRPNISSLPVLMSSTFMQEVVPSLAGGLMVCL